MKETKSQNFYEVQIRRGRKVIAHTSCHFSNDEIQIRDLYVLKKFRGNGLGEVLLAKIFDYATEKQAARITAYCGAEPFCADGQIPLEEEIAWYQDHGFNRHHDVMGVTPCMVKDFTYIPF